MARYNQAQQPYSPPPYQRHPYPPPPYAHQHYAQQQHHYPQAPYPPHPQYAHPHPAYPPSDPNQYPQYHDGYPPQKKHKSNPVVTRYPPPPNNYQSPPPPPQPGYPAPHQHYPPQPAYSPPAQAIPPPPPPGWVPPPPPGWRGPVPPPPPPQPSYYPPTYPQPQHQHQPYYPPQPPYVPEEPVGAQQARSQHNQASHWNASHGQGRPGQRRFTSLQWKRSDQKDAKDTKPSVTPKTTPKKAGSATPALSTTDGDSNGPLSQASPDSQSAKGTSVPPKMLPVKYDESEDFDFDSYYADEDEDVDKSLSLGTIVWLPGQQVKRAIPALYSEMDTQPPEPLLPSNEADRDGVSMYTTAENEEEQSQPIKASREWNDIKDDPIFARLVDNGTTIPIEQVIANRNRPPLTPEHMDADEEEGEIRKEQNILEDARISLYSKPPPSTVNGYGGDLPMEEDNSDDDDEPYSPPPAPEKPAASDIKSVENRDEPMGDAPSLEAQDSEGKHETNGEKSSSVSIKVETEAVQDATPLPLGSVKKEHSQEAQPPQNFSSKSSASASPATPNLKSDGDGSHKPSSFSKTPELVRDQSQEGILARLGVTGEPVPLSKAPAIVRNQSQEDVLAKLGVTGDPKPTRVTPGLPHNPQEDVLARLGVTGEPKPTRGTPGPAHNLIARPPPPREELRRASSSSENIKSSFSSAIPPAPPPPPPPPPPAEDTPPAAEELDPWTSAFDVSRGSPKSETSQHTQVGSDFHEEPEEAPKETEDDSTVVLEEAPVAKERTPTPPNIGKNSLRSRKRTRTNSEEVDDGVRRQKDDVTPRLRRRQPKVASAYGRRW